MGTWAQAPHFRVFARTSLCLCSCGLCRGAQCLALRGPRWALELGACVPQQGQAAAQHPPSSEPYWEPAQFPSPRQASDVFTSEPCGDQGLREGGVATGEPDVIWC